MSPRPPGRDRLFAPYNREQSVRGYEPAPSRGTVVFLRESTRALPLAINPRSNRGEPDALALIEPDTNSLFGIRPTNVETPESHFKLSNAHTMNEVREDKNGVPEATPYMNASCACRVNNQNNR
jgi:hypothetical protein